MDVQTRHITCHLFRFVCLTDLAFGVVSHGPKTKEAASSCWQWNSQACPGPTGGIKVSRTHLKLNQSQWPHEIHSCVNKNWSKKTKQSNRFMVDKWLKWMDGLSCGNFTWKKQLSNWRTFAWKHSISGIRWFRFRQADEHFAAKAVMEGPIAKVNTLPKSENSETLTNCTFWLV